MLLDGNFVPAGHNPSGFHLSVHGKYTGIMASEEACQRWPVNLRFGYGYRPLPGGGVFPLASGKLAASTGSPNDEDRSCGLLRTATHSFSGLLFIHRLRTWKAKIMSAHFEISCFPPAGHLRVGPVIGVAPQGLLFQRHIDPYYVGSLAPSRTVGVYDPTVLPSSIDEHCLVGPLYIQLSPSKKHCKS